MASSNGSCQYKQPLKCSGNKSGLGVQETSAAGAGGVLAITAALTFESRLLCRRRGGRDGVACSFDCNNSDAICVVIYIYIYIYIYAHAHAHTHTHVYIYIYIYIVVTAVVAWVG